MPGSNVFELDGKVFNGAANGGPFHHSGEADHRIANSFTLLAGTVSNRARDLAKQKRTMSSEEVSLILGEISSRIAAVGQLHRDLANQPETPHLDLDDHLWKLCDDLIDTLSPDGRFTLIRSSRNSCPVRADDALPVSLIVTEVVTNALKYAHPAGVAGILSLGCRREADGSVLIEVADDGVGLPEGFDPRSGGGLGTRTVALLAQRLGAQVSYASSGIGLRFTLKLPPSAVVAA